MLTLHIYRQVLQERVSLEAVVNRLTFFEEEEFRTMCRGHVLLDCVQDAEEIFQIIHTYSFRSICAIFCNAIIEVGQKI